MKIRTDFVSNSSSSSWVIVGKIYSESALVKLFKADATLLDRFNEANKKYEYDYKSIEDAIDDLGGVQEILEFLIGDFGSLQIYCDNSGDKNEYAIGLDPSSSMLNTETLGQFKQRVADKLTKINLSANASQMKFITGGSDAGGLDFFYDCG